MTGTVALVTSRPAVMRPELVLSVTEVQVREPGQNTVKLSSLLQLVLMAAVNLVWSS